jgi:threonine dehydrogenase-like Zn-dependent dehydrogenase
LLAASDVLGTGWFAAVAAQAGPHKSVAVVGDGAVGLLAVLAANQLGAERIIAMSRHQPRQQLAREYGATDIVEERSEDGVAKIKELTGGLGADSVVEAVGTEESMLQAIGATRPGGHVGYVGVAHGVELPVEGLFWSLVHLHGGPAPVRRFLPELIDLIWNRQIDPARSSTSASPWSRPPLATRPWTSAEPSKPCCSHRPVTGWGGRAGVVTGV